MVCFSVCFVGRCWVFWVVCWCFVKIVGRKFVLNVGLRFFLVRSGFCGCVRFVVSKERFGRGWGFGFIKGFLSIFCF